MGEAIHQASRTTTILLTLVKEHQVIVVKINYRSGPHGLVYAPRYSGFFNRHG